MVMAVPPSVHAERSRLARLGAEHEEQEHQQAGHQQGNTGADALAIEQWVRQVEWSVQPWVLVTCPNRA